MESITTDQNRRYAQNSQVSPAENLPKIPLSDRICDWVCFAFALWTLCCHVVVALGGTLPALILLYAAVCCTAAAAVLIVRNKCTTISRLTEPPASLPAKHDHSFAIFQICGLVVCCLGALAFARHGNALVLWFWIAALLSVATAVFVCGKEPFFRPALHRPSLEIALWALSLFCVALTLVAHRWSADDAFYVNLAVAAVDFPERPLLRYDSLHGIEGLPLHMPAYRVQSYELWNGALSYLSGIPAIYCFHWISAATAALLVPLAHAKLFRLLTPRQWPWATAILVLVLISAGETHRWYGSFAFVRMWHGNAIFISVFLPLKLLTPCSSVGLCPCGIGFSSALQ